MTLIQKVRAVLDDESGAVTVDFVVLTAAVVILSIGAIAALDTSIDGIIAGITTTLGTVQTAPAPVL